MYFKRTNFFLAFYGPSHHPLFLLVEARLRRGKALGGEKGKGLGCGYCHEERRKFERGFTAYDRI
jgi:hypothetical protein